MLVAGIGFYIWAFVKPPCRRSRITWTTTRTGGPLHMGHDSAELHLTRCGAAG